MTSGGGRNSAGMAARTLAERAGRVKQLDSLDAEVAESQLEWDLVGNGQEARRAGGERVVLVGGLADQDAIHEEPERDPAAAGAFPAHPPVCVPPAAGVGAIGQRPGGAVVGLD